MHDFAISSCRGYRTFSAPTSVGQGPWYFDWYVHNIENSDIRHAPYRENTVHMKGIIIFEDIVQRGLLEYCISYS